MGKKSGTSYRQLPSVEALLQQDEVKRLIEASGRELAVFAVRESIGRARRSMKEGGRCPDVESLLGDIRQSVRAIAAPSLKPVINATGIIIHTNLGRAPLGKKVLSEMGEVVSGYCNLEFDLDTGGRGRRNAHISRLLAFITGAEEALVVNNNAAALVLALNTLAAGKGVIVSRGELIEIGGSFRIPDILAASGAKMIEVGTTNKTRLADYEKAIDADTAIILKAHKSNYVISGFTEEVPLAELAKLAGRRKLLLLYDIGSGLLRKPKRLPLGGEPDVRSALRDGADLVAFSGDKLLGGPQSGIIVGKKKLLSRLGAAPLMRALRVGKLTLAALASVARSYLADESLAADLPLFRMLGSGEQEIRQRAEKLARLLRESGISCEVVESKGQCGGGTLPDLAIDSFAVRLLATELSRQERSLFARTVHERLMKTERPVVAVLRQGEIVFDVLTLEDGDLEPICSALCAVLPGRERQ